MKIVTMQPNQATSHHKLVTINKLAFIGKKRQNKKTIKLDRRISKIWTSGGALFASKFVN